ncbi:interleukin-17D-like [Strongylocentrotus purpuratus]|uniref:Interleukin 17-like protein n=1 Tax=Strongylocentrotus purpuratus TaxID=7668 RepID=A0A7M7P3H6_STRPU|nr:interleukin-17D-like [Strongylocentrotus purpuratus]
MGIATDESFNGGENTKTVVLLLALIAASSCNPVPLTCISNHSLAQSGLYPNKAAFAVQSFTLSPIDIGRSQSSTCSNTIFTGISSDATCPSGTAPGSTLVVNENGLCPWTYVECFDADRIPMALQVAQCQCSGCLDPYTHTPNPNLQCTPVKRNIKVLKKTRCAGGMYKYEEQTLAVPVACACMRQRVA